MTIEEKAILLRLATELRLEELRNIASGQKTCAKCNGSYFQHEESCIFKIARKIVNEQNSDSDSDDTPPNTDA